MSRSTILVTGGAGYIGSHVVRQLREADENVVVLDDLSTGFRESVADTPLVVGNTGDSDLVARLLDEHGVGTVMHFAARTIVPESVADPLRYYRNNTCATRNLLECCVAAGINQIVDGGGLRHSRQRPGQRRLANATDQSLRQLQADVRMDAA